MNTELNTELQKDVAYYQERSNILFAHADEIDAIVSFTSLTAESLRAKIDAATANMRTKLEALRVRSAS